jgi:hypothetical protein
VEAGLSGPEGSGSADKAVVRGGIGAEKDRVNVAHTSGEGSCGVVAYGESPCIRTHRDPLNAQVSHSGYHGR